MVPGTIRSAREASGVIVYDVEVITWEGFAEEEIQPRDTFTMAEMRDMLIDIDRNRSW